MQNPLRVLASAVSVLFLGGSLVFLAPSKAFADDKHQKMEKRELKEHQRMERELYGKDAIREHQRIEKREMKGHQRDEREFYRGYNPYDYGRAYPYPRDRYDDRYYYPQNRSYEVYPDYPGYYIYRDRHHRR